MKIRKGWVVRIKFRDHVEASNNSLAFVVYGRVHKVTQREVVVSPWHHVKKLSPRFDSNNEVRYVILRSTITSIDRLVPQD